MIREPNYLECAGRALLVPIIGRRRRFRTEVVSIIGRSHGWLKHLPQSGVALRFPPHSKFVIGLPRFQA
jgi:hypothetical protein